MADKLVLERLPTVIRCLKSHGVKYMPSFDRGVGFRVLAMENLFVVILLVKYS